MSYITLIIEDNLYALESLSILVSQFPEFEIKGRSSTKDDAINKIKFYKPEVLFMDIHLGQHTGFEILEECKGDYKFVILTTSYDEYALKSYEYEIVNYVMKPVTKDSIRKSLDKILHLDNYKINSSNNKIDNEIPNESNVKKEKNTNDSFFYYDNKQWKTINYNQVMYIKGEQSYCSIYTSDFSVKLSKNLKTITEQFHEHTNFIRVHKSYTVNINYIKVVKKGIKPSIILHNDIEIPVSILEKETLFNLLGI